MNRHTITVVASLAFAAGLTSSVACGGSDSDGGASPSGGAGTGTGGTGTGGTGTGGTGTGGTGTAGTGGTGTGGTGTGGATGAGTMTYTAKIGPSKTLAFTCNSSQTDPDTDDYLGVIHPGNQLNVGCPGGVGHVTLKSGGCYFVIKDIEKLPAGAFDFTLADRLTKFELQCQTNSTDNLALAGAFAKALSLKGTWDPATRALAGTFSGTWEDGGTGKPAGELTGSFSVTAAK